MENENYYDITIIGGGPIGIFAATYARMRQAKIQLIESLDQLGGQVSALFPAKKLYDIPGFSVIKGDQLISNLLDQNNQFKPDIFFNETVQNITKTDLGFSVTTTKKKTYSRTIIIATGVGAFQPRRLAVENAEKYENKQLRYFVKDLQEFRGKDVVIAGGGDSAVDWALEIQTIAKSVSIIHRRDKFRALESSIEHLRKSNTNFETPYLISALDSADDKIKITIKKVKTDEKKELLADFLLVNYGFVSNNKTLKSWNIETDHNLIKVKTDMETSIPGIYAIGDTIEYPGRVNLIATGFGEAPIAVNSAMNKIHPDIRQAAHSTQLIKNFPELN
ncbi:NAD(P)/FAD-dependent oxidoreductase [Liquorilactobacillus hordei]|uniref:NAD(P)/FAD-dependent oxidoreductase n=1 Tax=Liquorilactobacillus hordei TaxID=468911 RepID=UPI001CC0F6B7|nr:NAD(P)/FAD-dependent oxidoreductase [Liquorilactobacillus hordei]MBZ2406768.1 ferredoxin--NADP(+) reductase [Liquorilactobacillus hordei]